MKVITVKQPWAYLICSDIKPIENRSWKLPEKYRGERVLIHASGKSDKEPYMIFTDEQADIFINSDLDFNMLQSYSETSRIIGSIRFKYSIINYPSIWAEKTEIPYKGGDNRIIYNWVATDAVLFEKPILNVKGKLGFWDYPAELIECPACGKVCIHQTDDPLSRFTHQCDHCGFWITESDYQRVK